jgi:hypothetical protein
MSEQPTCPECGDQMQLLETGVVVRPGQPDFHGLIYSCVNPDCPGKDSDLAPLADGQEWLNQPGTEGGANGGA